MSNNYTYNSKSVLNDDLMSGGTGTYKVSLGSAEDFNNSKSQQLLYQETEVVIENLDNDSKTDQQNKFDDSMGIL